MLKHLIAETSPDHTFYIHLHGASVTKYKSCSLHKTQTQNEYKPVIRTPSMSKLINSVQSDHSDISKA